jgi:hypothetical protein
MERKTIHLEKRLFYLIAIMKSKIIIQLLLLLPCTAGAQCQNKLDSFIIGEWGMIESRPTDINEKIQFNGRSIGGARGNICPDIGFFDDSSGLIAEEEVERNFKWKVCNDSLIVISKKGFLYDKEYTNHYKLYPYSYTHKKYLILKNRKPSADLYLLATSKNVTIVHDTINSAYKDNLFKSQVMKAKINKAIRFIREGTIVILQDTIFVVCGHFKNDTLYVSDALNKALSETLSNKNINIKNRSKKEISTKIPSPLKSAGFWIDFHVLDCDKNNNIKLSYYAITYDDRFDKAPCCNWCKDDQYLNVKSRKK